MKQLVDKFSNLGKRPKLTAAAARLLKNQNSKPIENIGRFDFMSRSDIDSLIQKAAKDWLWVCRLGKIKEDIKNDLIGDGFKVVEEIDPRDGIYTTIFWENDK